MINSRNSKLKGRKLPDGLLPVVLGLQSVAQGCGATGVAACRLQREVSPHSLLEGRGRGGAGGERSYKPAYVQHNATALLLKSPDTNLTLQFVHTFCQV